jgi:hypothetical protein
MSIFFISSLEEIKKIEAKNSNIFNILILLHQFLF